MAGARSFEELECWQEARKLVTLVFTACKTGELSRDFGTANQMKRAAVSVMNNIAEGHGRRGSREFARFLDIAQSSSLEVKSMTYILDDLDYLPPDRVAAIRAKADQVKRIVRGLIRHLETRMQS